MDPSQFATSNRGKVAVVTGAGRGIGRAIAIALANTGATLALIDVDVEATRRIARKPRLSLISKACWPRLTLAASITTATTRSRRCWPKSGHRSWTTRGSGASHAEYGLDPPATEQRVSGALHSSDAALLIESSSRPNVALAGTLERDSTTDQTYC
ncbi:hypothetical protein KXV77_003074 [Aspergillus fumigatus]|nr:hypothetical protein KXV77_003074 [Aspergillus fumigatus]